MEGKQYQIDGMHFIDIKLPNANRHSFGIAQSSEKLLYQRDPDASIHWIMELNSLEELQGKEIDFSQVESEAKANQFAEPLVLFTLEQQNISVYTPSAGNNMVIKIDRVDEKYVEGSFSGADYTYFSKNDNITRAVNITGNFRARLKRSGL